MRRIAADLFTAFDPEKSFNVEVLSAIAEGSEVAIEYTASGNTAAGKAYRNFYVARLTVRGRLVQELRPYNDTKHMYEALGIEPN
jgi:ketosteroid isomerase-like protein